jgi:murein DD-endopeptidase MepM/ murein hydrolase activator NlpD
VKLRIDEAGVATVRVRLTLSGASTHEPLIGADMGWVHTNRALTVSWPRGTTLTPGRYLVGLSARDHNGGTLLLGGHRPGQVRLTVKPRVKAPAKGPKPPLSPTPAPPAGVPTPAQSAARAVFPVAGAHSYGGPEDRFGAPRGGRAHEGQDVLAAEGTPIVAPMAGTILTASYQAGGAGYYAVEHTGVGFDLMFAHCQAGSLTVVAGQAVSAGGELCRTGQTGDATGPHLHFEMWVGGWRAAAGHPIDPLPYLEAWERAGAG